MAEYEPKPGWYATETQRIVNELPTWNKIRRRRDSVGQELTNAMAGVAMERHRTGMEQELRNKFPSTVDLNQPDLVTRVNMPLGVPFVQPETVYNFVFNSSFEIWPNQAILPQFWRHSGTGSVSVTDDGFIGRRALELQCSSGQSVTVYQDLDRQIPANQNWSFSVWYSIDTAASLTVPATGFGLEAVGYLVDDTTETIRAPFVLNTDGFPRKLELTGSFSKQTTKVRVQVVVTNTGGFDFTDPVTVDLMMSEDGDTATSWRPHYVDNWPHVSVKFLNSPVLIESGNRAQFVETLEDFWQRAIPTRAEYLKTITEEDTADSAPSPVGGVTSYGTAGRWTEIDMYKEEWPYEVEAYSVGSSHKLRFIGSEVPDILGVFDLAFRNWRSYFEDDTTIEIEAITVYMGWIWVVHKKNDLASVQKRYLSIVDPRTPWPRPSYLEAWMTLELPTPGIGSLITRVEIRNDDQQHLYIGDGRTTYIYDLFYDYFMVSGRDIYLREEPTEITVIETDPTRRETTESASAAQFDRTHRPGT